MKQLLLGGFITLVVTALVQIMIIPWVQQRNRRRERWEKDVDALDLKHQDSWTPALIGYRIAMQAFREANGKLLNPPDGSDADVALRQQRISRSLNELERWGNEAHATWGELTALTRRVRRFRPNAPLWDELNDQLGVLHGAYDEVSELWYEDDATDEVFELTWEKCMGESRIFFIMLMGVSTAMLPPPRHALDRAVRRLIPSR